MQTRTSSIQALFKLDKPIVVVLDDIDRLETPEIRDIFKLVRLTANFPNIIYIVAFDRDRVEQALDEQGLPGRAYLEKILQVPVDLPVIPRYVLTDQIISALNDAFANIENLSPVNQYVWPDIFMEVIRPLIRNMRDVRRYVTTAHGTIKSLNGQIALADLLALEAIRIFLPDVFKLLHNAINGLTGSDTDPQAPPPPEEILKEQVNAVIEAAGDHKYHRDVVKSTIMLLFSAGGHHAGGSSYDGWRDVWLRERRVAHEDILRLYLERFETENLRTFMDAEQAWKYISDRDAFDNYLRSLDSTKLQHVIANLGVFEEQFAPEHIVSGATVLLNLLPLPEQQRGIFDWSSDVTVIRVVYRLLKSLNNLASIENAVRQILPELRSLSLKLKLINIIWYYEDASYRLVSEQMVAEVEKAWGEEVRSASVDDLVNEHDLLGVLLHTKHTASPSESPLNVDNASKLTLSLLRSARGESHVQNSPNLAWDKLVELYGDEAILKERIESLRVAKLEGSDDLIELADKYLGGYRDVGSQ